MPDGAQRYSSFLISCVKKEVKMLDLARRSFFTNFCGIRKLNASTFQKYKIASNLSIPYDFNKVAL